ncbi:hypothetical protein ACET3Z_032340 [Daucus carota]
MEEVLVREYDEERDFKMVVELEKSCKTTASPSNEGMSILSNMMGDDPLCRIRLYPLHVLLIAEILSEGEIVGIVRGCIKYVEIGVHERRRQVTMGSILGLRVSPTHRRKGVGVKLVQSIEEWLSKNGATYTFAATEENNAASTNLFTLRRNYIKLSSLSIFVQRLNPPLDDLPEGVSFEQLPTDQAISFYQTRLGAKDMYPTDIDMILKEKLSLGTWLCHFKEDNVKINHNDNKITGDSWMIFSIWNTCEAYKLQVKRTNHHSSPVYHAIEDDEENPKKMACDSIEKPFGFLFLFGLLGEGDRLGELVKTLWSFALQIAENVKDCKAIVTELGFSDPIREHVPEEVSTACIDDSWYAKKINNISSEDDDLVLKGELGNVFVDPRDF